MTAGDKDVLFDKEAVHHSAFSGVSRTQLLHYWKQGMYSGLFSLFPGTQIMHPVLEWEIMSMQILLREGFYSLKRNLPLGNWTFFYNYMLMRFPYGAAFSLPKIPGSSWLIFESLYILHGITKYGFEQTMSQGQIKLLCWTTGFWIRPTDKASIFIKGISRKTTVLHHVYLNDQHWNTFVLLFVTVSACRY